MTQIDDEKVINWIKHHGYSNLAFLDNCWFTSKNEWYLGFYYFIQYLKQESIDEVFARIVSRYDSEFSAYCYLGDTAKKIYNSFNQTHIPASFYRQAIKLNSKNPNAHWGLFATTDDTTSCINSLNLYYENSQFERLGRKIDLLNYGGNEFSGFSPQDWQTIKSFIQDERITCEKGILLLFAHFYLDEVAEGLSLIEATDHVDVEIIKAYFDRGLISKEFALSKLYDFQVDGFLGDDDGGIYQVYLQKKQKDKTNPTRAVLITKAFHAKEYQDVITFHEEAPADNYYYQLDINARLYYLLALSYLKQAPNKPALEFINNKADSLRDESKALYQAVRCKHRIDKLEQLFSQKSDFNETISIMGDYQEALKALDSPDLIKHNIYQHLSDEIRSLKIKWNNAYYHKQLAEMKTKLSSGDMDSDDFLRLYNFGIKCNEFDFVIEIITEFHSDNTPTISSYNCIGVCYERKMILVMLSNTTSLL
jgi:hypothetical protein